MLWPAMRRGGVIHNGWRMAWTLVTAFIALSPLLANGTNATFITFENCLDSNIVNSNPRQLQFVPYYFNAKFNTSDPRKHLNITIYGNVTGQAVEGTYPPPSDPSWTDPNSTFGKIVDISPTNNVFSTLFERYQFLNYDASEAPASQFCLSTVNSSCPLGPSFNGSASNPYSLSAFTVAHDLNSSYSLATLAATIRIRSGDKGAPDIACVSASITPDLGSRVAGLLRYLPVVVLVFVGVATLVAAVFSPWGTSDPFKWTTNYGRDQDLLRLVTPGFGDCLQYIQFVFLTATLSLNYPGFYQPAASQFGWSSLAFNESFLTRGSGSQSLVDGIYTTNGTLGMTTMTQLIGMSSRQDLWPCMAIWLAVICLAAILFCQLAFLLRWIYFRVTDTSEEDLRRKNWPLTGGMFVRVVFNLFLLPVVSISMFQLLLAPSSRFYILIVAVLLLFGIILIAGWILYVIYRTKPRALLFDDLPTLLLYGFLYNTYSDERAPFALIPVLLTFMRGVAIGAIQATGIAQIIILAICEVVFILMVHAFRPFSSPTHMNLMHTLFAAVRLASLLLMVSFLPTLGVSESSKGWIGYVILLMHAIVLVFGYFLNSIQTMIEVFARMAGAGGDPSHGAQRGDLISYGWRQLKNKQPNKDRRPGSMTSDAAILANDAEAKNYSPSGRARSLSASSRMLLNTQRMSGQSSLGDMPGSPGDAASATSPFPSLPSNGTTTAAGARRASQSQLTAADPYYRPPRARRATLDAGGPATKRTRYSNATSGEWGTLPPHDPSSPTEAPPTGGGSDPPPSAAFFRHQRAGSDPDVTETPAPGPGTDYAVREVDFYYGVTRGPALSSMPTRKRKTGPADPVGPVSSATSWMQRLLLGGKKKDKSKGFEVVRSSRAPPPELVVDRRVRGSVGEEEEGEELVDSPPMRFAPYRDMEDGLDQARPGAGQVPEVAPAKERVPLDDEGEEEEEEQRAETPNFLGEIARGPSLRINFEDTDTSYDPGRSRAGSLPHPPVPRKSSRRASSRDIDVDIAQGVGGGRSKNSSVSPAGRGLRADDIGADPLGRVVRRTPGGSGSHFVEDLEAGGNRGF